MSEQRDPLVKYEAATRWVSDNGHWVRETDWQRDSPTPGRATVVCRSCGGTIEMREDGSLAWPGETATCIELLRAEAEQREGISDYYQEGTGDAESAWDYVPDPADFR